MCALFKTLMLVYMTDCVKLQLRTLYSKEESNIISAVVIEIKFIILFIFL